MIGFTRLVTAGARWELIESQSDPLHLDRINIHGIMSTTLQYLTREERVRIAKQHGDGYRYMAMKANATLGVLLLNMDQETLEYLDACEELIMTGGGLQRRQSPGRVVARDKF